MVQSINEPHVPSDEPIGPHSINEPPLPAPLAIVSISPDTCVAGNPEFELTVTGTGFSVGSVIYVGGTAKETVFGDVENLMTLIDPTGWSASGSVPVPVMVRDSGEQSNSVDLTVTDGSIASAVERALRRRR